MAVNPIDKPEFEEVSKSVRRLRVPGGWIYLISLSMFAFDTKAVFVPEPPEIELICEAPATCALKTPF